ncbi:MAG: extensin family protein [Myxococcota bacterium]
MLRKWKLVVGTVLIGAVIVSAAACAFALKRYGPDVRERISAPSEFPSLDWRSWKRRLAGLRDAGPALLREVKREASRRPYVLDPHSRRSVRDGAGRVSCPDVELETYRGDVISYRPAVKAHPKFRERLERFDRIVERVAIETYGRAPDRVVHFGVYNCRTIRGKSRLSEHAFGNAIDVAGFEFDAVEGAGRSRYASGFTVSVLQHWDARSGFEAQHGEFLKALARDLDEDRVFRGMLMPPAPGHDDHFHLDMGRLIYLNGSAYSD